MIMAKRKPKTLAELEPRVGPSLDEYGDGWEMHCGDSLTGLALLGDKSIDATVSDPPFEDEAHTQMRRQRGKATRPGGNQVFRGVEASPLDFKPITDEQRAEVSRQIARVTTGFAVTFCQVEAVAAWRQALTAGGMKYRRTIPWVKPDAMPSLHGRWPGQSFESIVTTSNHDDADWEAIVLASHSSSQPCPLGGKAIAYNFSRAKPGQPGGPNGVRSPHPTTKPLPLMLKLIEHFTRPGDTVLDPFAGSGTTGVACRQLGRKFIGWEIDPVHFATACRRLRGEAGVVNPAQPDLFAALGGAA